MAVKDEQKLIERVVKTLEKTLFEDRIGEIKKILENIAESTYKKQNKQLQSIDKIVSSIKEEQNDQGDEIEANTKALKNLRAEFESFRDNHNKKTKNANEKTHEIVENAMTDAIKNEVPNAVASVIEPVKHQVQPTPKKSLLKRLTAKLGGWR